MRLESKKLQRQDRRLNVFLRRNKSFPAQYGGDEETPDAEEPLRFWRSISNKDTSEGWKQEMSIRVLPSEKNGPEGKELQMVFLHGGGI